MDELVSVMEEIRDLLSKANEKLDDIKGYRSFRSLADVYEKLDEMSEASITLTDISLKLETLDRLFYDKLEQIQGNGLYNSISDVADKLDQLISLK